MAIINLTPHQICLNDGQVFPPSGTVARVKKEFVAGTKKVGEIPTFRDCVIGLENVPPEDGNIYIVSSMVYDALDAYGPDAYFHVVAPSTGHPSTVRNEQGHIVSVAGFMTRY